MGASRVPPVSSKAGDPAFAPGPGDDDDDDEVPIGDPDDDDWEDDEDDDDDEEPLQCGPSGTPFAATQHGGGFSCTIVGLR